MLKRFLRLGRKCNLIKPRRSAYTNPGLMRFFSSDDKGVFDINQFILADNENVTLQETVESPEEADILHETVEETSLKSLLSGQFFNKVVGNPSVISFVRNIRFEELDEIDLEKAVNSFEEVLNNYNQVDLSVHFECFNHYLNLHGPNIHHFWNLWQRINQTSEYDIFVNVDSLICKGIDSFPPELIEEHIKLNINEYLDENEILSEEQELELHRLFKSLFEIDFANLAQLLEGLAQQEGLGESLTRILGDMTLYYEVHNYLSEDLALVLIENLEIGQLGMSAFLYLVEQGTTFEIDDLKIVSLYSMSNFEYSKLSRKQRLLSLSYFESILEKGEMTKEMHRFLNQILRAMFYSNNELEQFRALKFKTNNNLPILTYREKMDARKFISLTYFQEVSKDELIESLNMFQLKENPYPMKAVMQIVKDSYFWISDLDDPIKKAQVFYNLANFHIFMQRNDRLLLTDLFLGEIKNLTAESDPKSAALLTLVADYYFYPIPEKIRDSFEKLLCDKIDLITQPILENTGTFSGIGRTGFMSPIGSALLKMAVYQKRITKQESGLILLKLTRNFTALNDFDFVHCASLLLTEGELFARKYLYNYRARLKKSMSFYHFKLLLQTFRNSYLREYGKVLDKDTIPDSVKNTENEIFSYFEFHFLKLQKAQTVGIREENIIEGLSPEKLFENTDQYRDNSYFFSEQKIQSRIQEEMTEPLPEQRFISFVDLAEISYAYSFRELKPFLFWNGIESLVIEFSKTHPRYIFQLKHLSQLSSFFSRANLGSKEFWGFLEENVKGKFRSAIHRADYNYIISIMNSFSHSKIGSNTTWAEFEAFTKFYCGRVEPQRGLGSIIPLIRRGKVIDRAWANTFIEEHIENPDLSYGIKKSLVIAARAQSLNYQNFESLVELVELEMTSEESQLEQIKLNRIIDQRYEMYNKFSKV